MMSRVSITGRKSTSARKSISLTDALESAGATDMANSINDLRGSARSMRRSVTGSVMNALSPISPKSKSTNDSLDLEQQEKLQNDNEELQSEKQELQNQLNEAGASARRALEKFKDQHQEYSEKLDEANEELERVRAENASLRQQLTTAQAIVAASHQSADQQALQEKLNNSAADLDRLKAEHMDLQEKHKQALSVQDSLKAEHMDLQEKHKQALAVQDAKGLKAQAEALQSHSDGVARRLSQFDSVQAEKLALQHKVDTSAGDYQKLNAEHKDLQEKHKKALADLQDAQRLKADAAASQSQHDNVKAEKLALQEELKTHVADLGKVKAEADLGKLKAEADLVKLKAEHMDLSEHHKKTLAALHDANSPKAQSKDMQAHSNGNLDHVSQIANLHAEKQALQYKLDLMKIENQLLQARATSDGNAEAIKAELSLQAHDLKAQKEVLQKKLDKSMQDLSRVRAEYKSLESKLDKAGTLLMESDAQQDKMLLWFERNVNHIGLKPLPSSVILAPSLSGSSRPERRV